MRTILSFNSSSFSSRTVEIRGGKKNWWCSARNGGGKKSKEERQSARKRGSGRGEEGARDFDQEKVGVLDREASRKGSTIGSSPYRLDSRREREILSLIDSRFPFESEFSPLLHRATIERSTLSFATLQSGEFDKRSFTCLHSRYTRQVATSDTRYYIFRLWEKYLHICRINDQFVPSVHNGVIRKGNRNKQWMKKELHDWLSQCIPKF